MKTVLLFCQLLVATSALAPITSAAGPLQVPGVPNFYQVNSRIYRGGQPTDVAWSQLAKLGVRTVVDLRRESEHSVEAEARAVKAAGMRYVNVPMNGFEVPSPTQLGQVLNLFDAGDTVFVHCKQGRDRTGTVVAIYRIAREGWDNDKAMAEAQSCGIQWFSGGMKRLIRGYRADASTSTAARDTQGGGAPEAAPAGLEQP